MTVNDGLQRPTVANFLKYRLKPALVPVFLSSSAGVGLAIAGIPARLRLAGIPAPLARLLTGIPFLVDCTTAEPPPILWGCTLLIIRGAYPPNQGSPPTRFFLVESHQSMYNKMELTWGRNHPLKIGASRNGEVQHPAVGLLVPPNNSKPHPKCLKDILPDNRKGFVNINIGSS